MWRKHTPQKIVRCETAIAPPRSFSSAMVETVRLLMVTKKNSFADIRRKKNLPIMKSKR